MALAISSLGAQNMKCLRASWVPFVAKSKFCRFGLMVLAAFLSFYPSLTLAQPLVYTVEMTVPDAYRKLLEDNLDIYKWRANPRMDVDQLHLLYRKSPDNIRELLATEGFYSPRIEPAIEEKHGAWLVRFAIEPGEPVRVAKFDLQVRGDFADGSPENAARLEKLREQWSLRPGMVFRQADWEAAKRTALKLVIIERYPMAQIASSQATVNPETREAVLDVVVDSGPAFTFGTMQVNGLKRYPRSIVERLNPIEPGSPYSQIKLLDFQARLQDSPYFSNVLVSADISPDAPLGVPVKVEVVEKSSKKVGFGVGASTNTGARGQIEYQDLDFLDRAWRLTGLLKLESKKQLLSGDIQFPRTSAGYLDSVNTFSEHTNIEGEATTKFGLGAKRMRVVGKIETALAVQFLTERQQIAGAQDDRQQALTINYAWTRRDVDNLLYPTKGHLLTAQVGGGAKALLSDQDFARAYTKLIYFYPLGERGNFVLRGELGAVMARSRQGIPSDFLFRTGGDQSVRGYNYQSLGVKEGDAVVGGRYLGVVSAEYVQWLSPTWGAAVFYDVGDAADTLQDFNPAHGYGMGVRWKSPVGPLNVDVAYGQKVEKLRLHFSVGFAF